MKNSKIFFSLSITFVLIMIMAGCTNEKSLGSVLDDFFSRNSDRIQPTSEPTPQPTPTESYAAYNKEILEQTLTAFQSNSNYDQTPMDRILNDFYTNNNERGLEAVEDLLVKEPNNALALALRGAFKLRYQEWEAGFEDSNKALEIDPNLAFAHVNLAWYYPYFLSDWETAQNEIDLALELDPYLANAHCMMAEINDYVDNPQLTIDSYKKAIELRPDYYVAYCNFGVYTLYILDDYETGMAYFDIAIGINPDSGRVYSDLGKVDASNGNYESAIENYSQAIKLGFKTVNVYNNRADAYIKIGALTNAITDLETAIILDPGRDHQYNTAAFLIAYTNGDLEKALNYINQALELSLDSKGYMDTKAYILYKMGDLDEAFEMFSDLIEDEYVFAHYGRGLIYYSWGDEENAISDFQIFLNTNSSYLRIEEVKQLLEEMGVRPD